MVLRCQNQVKFLCKGLILSISFSVKTQRLDRRVFLFGRKCILSDECIF